MAVRPLKWWAEKPYASTRTRFWVQIPADILTNLRQIKLYYNNPNANVNYQPQEVFSKVRTIEGYWDFSQNGFNPITKVLFNQAKPYWDGYVNLVRQQVQPVKIFRPTWVDRRNWDYMKYPDCYALQLVDNEYIEIPIVNPAPSSQSFTLLFFLDLMHMNPYTDGTINVNGTLLQLRDINDTEILHISYNATITRSSVPQLTYYGRYSLQLNITCGQTTTQINVSDMYIPYQLPITGNAVAVCVLYEKTATYKRFVIQTFPTAGAYVTYFGDTDPAYITLSARKVGNNYQKFGKLCVGGISLVLENTEEPALSFSQAVCMYKDFTAVLEYLNGIYFYTYGAINEPSYAFILPPRGRLNLSTNTPNLAYGNIDTSIPGYNRSIYIYFKNPSGITLREYADYGFVVLPIELNTQDAINQGLLRADLRDVLFVYTPETYTPPAPPPPPPPPPTEEPPAAPAMPPQGTCAYSFADADSENPVFGLAYDGMARILRDAGIAFPVPYNSNTQTIELYPVPAYGVTFVRWLLSYKDSQSGETKTATGVGLPISVRGLNIDWGVGVTVKFFVKGIKGVARQPSSDKSKFGAHSASGYLQLPTIQPTWRSGDYTIRYGVGYDVYKIAGDMKIRYSVGIDYTPVSGYLYQNVRTGEEDWELVFASPTSQGAHPVKEHLQGYRLRHFHASGNMMYLLAVSETPPVKVKLITINLSNGNVTSSSAVTLGAEGDDEEKRYYPSFGAVAVGHGGIVYANTHGAVYFPFSGAHEPLLLTFLSSSFPIEKKMWSSVGILVVPEGFLFLPYAILWDMDTYYDYSTNIEVSEGDRLIPVYFNGVAGVVVRSREYSDSGGSSTLKAFYIWGGFNKGLVRAQVDAAEGLEKVPPYLSGALVNNRWYAFNAAAHPDEATIAEYELIAQGDMENWKFVTSALLKVLPLPFSAPALRARWKPPAWGELWGFNITANATYIYFSRVWDRIYRLDVGSKEIRLAHSIPYLDFGGNIIPRFMGGEEAWLMFSYNLEHGRVYCAHLRAGERLQIWRQTNPVTPPPAPTITFPPPDIQVPRQFDVQFKPHAYTYPQEFSVTIVAETANGASVWHYYSTLHRNLFEVSLDNGLNFAPMQGPVTVTENNDGSVVVKFNIPYPLPASATVTVTVRAIGIVQ